MPTSEFEPDIVSALRPVRVGADVVLASGEPRPAKVRVCIPVRNAEATLDRCLDSVLAQARADVGVVIVDNDSTDRTFALAAARAARDGRVVAYRNPRDIGRIANWNRCLDLVGDCDYAKLLMSPDELLPEFCEQTAAVLDAFPSVVLVRSSLSFRHPDGRIEFLPHFSGDRLIAGPEARDASLTRGNLPANPSGQLWRRSATEGLRFDESLPWAADYDFALRLLERGDFAYRRAQLYVFDLGAGRFHSRANAWTRLADDCEVAVRHSGPDALPLLEARAVELGGGEELERLLDETRRRFAQPPRLDVRGTSLLLPLDDGWRGLVDAYVREFAVGDDVTLVLSPSAGDDVEAVVAELEGTPDGTPDILLDTSGVPAARRVAEVDCVVTPRARLRELVRVLRRQASPGDDPLVDVVLLLGSEPLDESQVRATLDALARQTFQGFRVVLDADQPPPERLLSIGDASGVRIEPSAPQAAYVASVRPGEVWAADALSSQLVVAAARGSAGCVGRASAPALAPAGVVR